MGAEFAAKYPKIASRLVLEPDKCEDPHVERLLEGFAFLAARVHLKIDDEFPEITEALLSILYPHYMRPIPSMSIVKFQLDPEQGKPRRRHPNRRAAAMLNSDPSAACRASSAPAMTPTLWPVEVTARSGPRRPSAAARSRPPTPSAAIRIELQCLPTSRSKQLGWTRLRFYLNGEGALINTLYELLCNNCAQIVRPRSHARCKGAAGYLPASALRPVGFDEDEGMLPYPRR